jgi:outer membrane protease
MKKCLFFLMAFIAAEISAQEYGHVFSAGASVGLLSGQAEEIVFRNTNSKNKMSQLLWNMKPLVYLGFDLHYNWQKPRNKWGIFADGFFKFGIRGETGIMEDRDWTDSSYADFLTHYSVHDNTTDGATLIDVNAGASFNIFDNLLFKVFLSYGYMNFSWAAGGGSILYPSANGGHGYLITNSDTLTYKQVWNMLSVGISVHSAFSRYFDAGFSVKLSPAVWCTSDDNHILRNLIITAEADGGFLIEPNLLFSFTPNDYFKLSLSMAYRNISGLRGDSVYKENGQAQANIPKNISGAGYSSFDFGITAKFRLFKL